MELGSLKGTQINYTCVTDRDILLLNFQGDPMRSVFPSF